MTGLGFLDLPVAQQTEIINHVKASAALMTDALSNIRVLTDRELEDICRWVLDGYRRSALVEAAYDEGYEKGHEDAAFAIANADGKAVG